MNNINNNGSFVPAIIYNNVVTEKLQILKDNKGKAEFLKGTIKDGAEIGPAVDLSKQFSQYFIISQLKKTDMYICRTLLIIILQLFL